jgi:hypothetical protein
MMRALRGRRIGIYVALQLSVLMLIGATARAAAWVPPQDLSWYWQLQGTVDNAYGAAAYDIDGFDNSPAEVAALHAAGKRVICYIDVGTWENWRADAGQFPSSVLGKSNGWPGERWLDVRQPVVRALMTARFQMCQQKGFDAIEPDNMDGYANSTGFPLTAQDQLSYDEWLAGEAHLFGLAVFQKNDPDQAGILEPYFDGVLDEQCNQYSECSSFGPYLRAGKPVLNAEYSLSASRFCGSDNADGMMGAVYSLNLNGSRYQPCWSGNPGFPPPSPPSPPPPPQSPQAPSGVVGSSPGYPVPPAGTVMTRLVLKITVGSITDRHGWVTVRLSCSEARPYCYGRVRLSVFRGDRRRVVLGTGRFRIRGHGAHLVRIRLSNNVTVTLSALPSVRVRIGVVAHDGAGHSGVSRRTATLKLGR